MFQKLLSLFDLDYHIYLSFKTTGYVIII